MESKTQHWTTVEQRARIREMAALGYTKREIADDTGLTKWQVEYRLMRDRRDAQKMGLLPTTPTLFADQPTPPPVPEVPAPTATPAPRLSIPVPGPRSHADEQVALIRKVLQAHTLSPQDRMQVVQSLVAM